ncbi:MAG TPA: hypothetical protein VF630_16260, partial [Hymenobacter sp.]
NPLADYPKLFLNLFEEQLKVKEALRFVRVAKYDGEILAVEIDNTIVDGASESVSEGLVDVYDMPPIDTWFYKVEGDNGILLFAWIPKEFKWFADEAIAVNVVDMLRWFKDWYPADYRRVME